MLYSDGHLEQVRKFALRGTCTSVGIGG